MDKQDKLHKLKAKMAKNNSLPLRANGINLVFGIGSAKSKIVFIGEAPGFHENKHMEPFVGRAGQLLNKLLGEIKIKRNDVYITNIVKHRPPKNRDPLHEELAAYGPYLAQELQIIRPKVIATLGRFSMNYFLPDIKISEAHGKLYKIKDMFIYPLYHPAAAMRSTKMMNAFKKDFKRLPKILNSD